MLHSLGTKTKLIKRRDDISFHLIYLSIAEVIFHSMFFTFSVIKRDTQVVKVFTPNR